MQIIYPSADITGLVVKGAGSQTADLQQWQNSSASVLAKVTAGGSIFATELKVTAGNSLGDSGGVGSYLVANTTNMSVITRTATNIGLIVKGVASQTANLQEWQNSSSTVMAHVDSSGNAKFASIDGGSA